MNTLLVLIDLMSIVAGLISIVISVWTLKTKSYQRYAEKIKEFDEQKKRIKEEIENDRRKFE